MTMISMKLFGEWTLRKRPGKALFPTTLEIKKRRVIYEALLADLQE